MTKKTPAASEASQTPAPLTLDQLIDQALADTPEGDSVEVRHQGQTYVAFRVGAYRHVENRGL